MEVQSVLTWNQTFKELPTCYSFLNQQQLLDTIGTSTDVAETECDDASDTEDVISSLEESSTKQPC